MNQKGFAPLLIVVLILAALVGGYLVYQNQPKPTPQPQPTTQPSSSPADETASWKTYTNTKYGITIKYPSNFTVSGDLKTPSDMDGVQFESVSFKMNSEEIRKDSAVSDIQIVVLDNPKKLSLHNWVNDKNNVAKYTIIGVNTIGEPMEITVNSYKGFKVLGKNDPFPNNVIIFLEHNGKIYELSLSPVNQAVDETVAAFEPMLSTFKFLP